jgi:hypothetical protein
MSGLALAPSVVEDNSRRRSLREAGRAYGRKLCRSSRLRDEALYRLSSRIPLASLIDTSAYVEDFAAEIRDGADRGVPLHVYAVDTIYKEASLA